MSSRPEASARMSSRSIGVTNVEFRRWIDVVRDPVALLLAEQDRAREVGVLGEVREHLVEQLGARAATLAAASSKRSKNSRSFGAKTCDEAGHGRRV